MSDPKTKSRLYRFHDKKTGDVIFCRANTFAQGLNYSTRDRYEGRVCTPDDMIGVSKDEILDATIPGVHPDQATPAVAG
jgi:hypothetical protein